MNITVTVLDGQGMPKQITVTVPDNATQKEIQAAIEKAKRQA
jgi:hypothetical protein